MRRTLYRKLLSRNSRSFYRAAILLFYKVVNKLIINIFISKVVKDRIDEKSKAWTDL